MPSPWEITEKTKDQWFATLRSALRASGHPEDEIDAAILHARKRLQMWSGHPYAYLERDNTMEATEEAADGLNYPLFEGLSLERAEHRGVIDADTADSIRALVLDGAFHCAIAHAAFNQARSLRRSASLPATA